MSAVGKAVAVAVVLAFLAAPFYGFAAILHSAYNALQDNQAAEERAAVSTATRQGQSERMAQR
jgi:hypothetical protein